MKSFSFLDVDSRIQQAVVIKALSGVLITLPGLYSAAQVLALSASEPCSFS